MGCVKRTYLAWVTSSFIIGLLLFAPMATFADGFGIPSNPELWSQISEGQQIAVVNLDQPSTAQIDLFITMLDESGESQEVTYFLPLGYDVSDFAIEERASHDFDFEVTDELDQWLELEADRVSSYKSAVQFSLLSGTLLINGAWSWPLWLSLELSSCGAFGGAQPIGTFETESSTIDIYDLTKGLT